MSLLLIALVSLLSCIAQLCQKQAANLGRRRGNIHLTGWIALSLLLLGLAMLLWLWVLRLVPVSVAYPMLSINFVLVAIAARVIWQESYTLRQWLGTLAIVAGVALMGESSVKGWVLALGSVLLVTLAQLALRLAMRDFPPVSALTGVDWVQHSSTLLPLAVGLLAYAFSMLCWMLALRHLPLNRLYPLLSLSYVLVWLAAVLLPIFGEPFRWSGLAGVLLILLGLLAIAVPPRRTRL